MGICDSEDIFQYKLHDLLRDTKGIRIFIDNRMVLRKDDFTKHIELLRVIFTRLCSTGIKVNTHKCSFGLNNIPYPGHIITWEVIIPDSNTTTTGLQVLIGMVQYYRDMWLSRLYALAPLT